MQTKWAGMGNPRVPVGLPVFLNGTQSTVSFLSPPVSWTTISEYKAYESIFECPGYARVQHYKVHYGCFSAIFRLGLFLFNFPFFVRSLDNIPFHLYILNSFQCFDKRNPRTLCVAMSTKLGREQITFAVYSIWNLFITSIMSVINTGY